MATAQKPKRKSKSKAPTYYARGDWAMRNGSFYKHSEYYGWSIYMNGDYMNDYFPNLAGLPDDGEIYCAYTRKQAKELLPLDYI